MLTASRTGRVGSMNWQQLCKLGLELPEVAEGTWYGTPALLVRGKGFVRLKEDGGSVVFLLDDVDDQELLITDRPEVYFVTDHYVGHAAVLARLSKLRVSECRVRLVQAWRRRASPALVRRFEAAGRAIRPRARAAGSGTSARRRPSR